MESKTRFKKQRRPQPNMLPAAPYCWKGKGEENPLRANKLEVSDPGKILLLTEAMYNNSTRDLEKKLNYYIHTETDAELVFVINTSSVSEEAVIQVVGQNELELEFRTSMECPIFTEAKTLKTSIFHYLSDFDLDLQNILKPFLPGIETRKEQEYEFITVPISSKLKKGKLYIIPFLICVVNSKNAQEFVTKIVSEVCRFSLPIVANTAKLEEEERIKKQCQSLLHVARRLFSHLSDINDLLREIMSEARRLTKAERCSLFLLDPDHIHLVAKVFDGIVHDNVNTEVRIAKDQGIAGHVAATGKLLNIKDAYKHPLFYKGIDKATGFRTRNILCFPIRDEYGIVGVAQLCNKNQGDFDFFDEEVALAFSLYCGLSIMHGLVYKKMQEAQIRSMLSNELMLYHMKISNEDVTKVLICTNRHAYIEFDSFRFSPKRVRSPETPCQILNMFDDLKLFEAFRIKRETLARFVLYVQKGYRDLPYHNWMHAFSVTHFTYVAIKKLNLVHDGYLTQIEALALMISCMCHDIDHRGTTNSFQLQSDSVLASLYSSEGSVMENHHLSQALCILNTVDCNFLECLTSDDYVICLGLIKEMILATDLANHFKLKERQEDIAKRGYDRNSSEDRHAFISLIMTCADLSDQIKDWDVAKSVSKQIYREFFQQGDMEKSMNKTPANMMDRDKADIPTLQIQFLLAVCLPAFTTLQEMFPESTDFVETISKSILCWETCKPIFDKLRGKTKSLLSILSSSEIDEEIAKLFEVAKPEEEEEEEEEIEEIPEVTKVEVVEEKAPPPPPAPVVQEEPPPAEIIEPEEEVSAPAPAEAEPTEVESAEAAPVAEEGEENKEEENA